MRHGVVVATAVLVAAVGAAEAQAPIRFAEMDANKDRTISRSEWRGTDASFRVHDWNSDGVLSRAEVRAGAWRPVRGTPPADFDNPDVTYVFGDWTVAGFLRLDHNSDTRIDASEWHFDREAFHRADHNRDSALSRQEFLGAPSVDLDDDREDSFANLDGDRDGRVTRSEWHGGAARFDNLDADRNGALTRDEVAGSTDTIPDLFTSVDANRDGAIARGEWHWSRESFDARDTDSDGRITRQEAAAGTAPPAAVEQAHRDGYERGLSDGRQAGQRDRTRGVDFSLDARPELSTGDPTYRGDAISRVAYQAGYRDGFRRGYREGYPQ